VHAVRLAIKNSVSDILQNYITAKTISAKPSWRHYNIDMK